MTRPVRIVLVVGALLLAAPLVYGAVGQLWSGWEAPDAERAEVAGDVTETEEAGAAAEAGLVQAPAVADEPAEAMPAPEDTAAPLSYTDAGDCVDCPEAAGDVHAWTGTGGVERYRGDWRRERDWQASVTMEASAAPGPISNALVGMNPVLVAQNLDTPLFATGRPEAADNGYDAEPRLFILERDGIIRILDEGVVRTTPFLDIRNRVSRAGEGGLLGIAFDPEHNENGIYYVYYYRSANGGETVVARYQVDDDPNVSDPATEEIILQIPQFQTNHNGGTIAFRPGDGDNLYVGTGDGGGGDDPMQNAQDPSNLLGKMLRIDVSGGVGTTYSIPPDNPSFGGATIEPEIWAMGLRNPYRFSFDSETGDMWIGDVGQKAREEVDFEDASDPGGRNYGWDFREGTIATPNPGNPVSPQGPGTLTDPLFDYAHQGSGCSGSITGGIVYNGDLASVQGEYFYGDYCDGDVWSYDPATMMDTQQTELEAVVSNFQLVAFGEGGFKEMYLVLASGSLYQVGPGGSECNDNIDNDGDGMMDNLDPGCASPTDSSELDMDVACDDGYDNDGDGDIDFGAGGDTGCTSATDATETAGVVMPPGGGGGGGDDDDDGGGGGGCGLGPELVLLVPLLAWGARRRRLI